MSDKLVIGGTPVHLLLEDQLEDAVRTVVARYRNELGDYRRLPAEAIREDITQISRDVLGIVIRCLRENDDLTPEEEAHLGRSAGRRAEEGFPLKAVLAAYMNGFQGIYRRLTTVAGPQDQQAVIALGTRLYSLAASAIGGAAAGYLRAFQARTRQETHVGRAVLEALVQGDERLDEISADTPELAAHYLVLRLRLGTHADVHEDGVDPRIVSRRVLGRLTEALDSISVEPVLNSLAAGGGIVLVPLESAALDWEKWRADLETVAEAAGVPITAAGAIATPSGVRSSFDRTGELLDVIRWFGKGPGLYRLEDLLLEYQLTRPSEARHQLAGLLDPLDDRPDLLETLVCHADQGFNRQQTARALYLHPNTVDYRLRRISSLTELDANHSAGHQRIIAAVAARRSEGSLPSRS